jgi:hypothetical protein
MTRILQPNINMSQEEFVRITADYCQGAYEHRTPPITIYHDGQELCPWPGCGFVIRVLAFNKWTAHWDEPTRERLRKSFWLGPGLLGACPHCGRDVLFSLSCKQPMTDSASLEEARLPEDWVAVGAVKPGILETASTLCAARAAQWVGVVRKPKSHPSSAWSTFSTYKRS